MIWRSNRCANGYRIQDTQDEHLLLRVSVQKFFVVTRAVLVLTPRSAVDIHVLDSEVNLLLRVHGGNRHHLV
ncbi:hypothetical protein D3C86_1872960 [compost metagenome]